MTVLSGLRGPIVLLRYYSGPACPGGDALLLTRRSDRRPLLVPMVHLTVSVQNDVVGYEIGIQRTLLLKKKQKNMVFICLHSMLQATMTRMINQSKKRPSSHGKSHTASPV